MTRNECGGLAAEIRRAHGYCLDSSDALTQWLARHPHVEREDARSMASMSHGIPFPSIRGKVEGPFPVYPERPYFDARVHEQAERGLLDTTPCLHERSR